MEGKPLTAKGSSGAPVVALFNVAGTNRLTFASSEAVQPLLLRFGLNEESSSLACSVSFFTEAAAPLKEYSATVRIDTRGKPASECLNDVQAWWAGMPAYAPCAVPERARLPMYSTWYSFHQRLDPALIEAQCRLAREIGCGSVIVDDGWQTDDNSRGYAYCGDWEVTPGKFPDMKAHVRRVHELGMKYLVWFSVPFVGIHSKAHARFKGKFLSGSSGAWAVLDPRFPEVREYLAGLYERAVREWDIDGLKLDFIDCFNLSDESRGLTGNGRDIGQPETAVEALLADVTARLGRVKPGVMIEFRQGYIGPLMRKFGNMFRAGDCPNDAIGNRARTLDVRMLCGSTAAHSDMLEWSPAESAESAALQLLNVFFSVPQISVMLDRVPPEHVEMLKFLLTFWRENRDVLLDGTIVPLHPELGYPQVHASSAEKYCVALYADTPIRLDGLSQAALIVVNAAGLDRCVLETAGLRFRTMTLFDCRGRIVRTDEAPSGAGLFRLPLVASGILVLK
jgi:alpha-galactosidase